MKVKIEVIESRCRMGYFKKGDTFIVGDLCPPICHELWHYAYPNVVALQNGAILDYGNEKASKCTVKCPDQERVIISVTTTEDE